MNTWVYIKSESRIWTVGFYTPNGEWNPESDYNSQIEAANRVHYLNGGSPKPDYQAIIAKHTKCRNNKNVTTRWRDVVNEIIQTV